MLSLSKCKNKDKKILYVNYSKKVYLQLKGIKHSFPCYFEVHK
jgi:hypothetical protein